MFYYLKYFTTKNEYGTVAACFKLHVLGTFQVRVLLWLIVDANAPFLIRPITLSPFDLRPENSTPNSVF